jgi:NDP-sugar pyrophosphorylase family protein
MKAVILAAGKGTRMRELTAALPKPMLRVQGKPILQHIVEGLVANQMREICVITGYQAATIEDFFHDGKSMGAQITYVRQEVQDGTGKAPELAKAFLGSDSFLLTYGDILVRPQTYEQMIARFENGKFDGVITVTPGEDVSKGGLNFFDEQFCLRRIVERDFSDLCADWFTASLRRVPGLQHFVPEQRGKRERLGHGLAVAHTAGGKAVENT